MRASQLHTPWVDACRVLSIFGVIVIHASAVVVQDYGKISTSNFIAGVWLDSLVRPSVPLFVMISGALLIPRIPAGNPLPRIFKVALPLMFWSLLYQAWVAHWTGEAFEIFATLGKAMQGPVMYHLWFAYMIIGLYLLLPIFQAIYEKIQENQRVGFYLLTLWVIATCIPSFYAPSILQHIQISAITGYSGYFLLGACLMQQRPSRQMALLWLAVFISSTAITATLTTTWTMANNRPDETAFGYFFPTVTIATIALFNLFFHYRPSHAAARIFSALAPLCFTIYFMHLMMLDILRGGLLGITVTPYSAHAAVALPAWSVTTFVLCAGTTYALRLVPGLARLVG